MTAIDRESIAWHAYVPYPLGRALADRPDIDLGEFSERIAAVTLFADISGFSALGEAFAVAGHGGAEALAAVLNRFFAPLIARIEAYGGVIGRFGGDAISAYFPLDDDRRTTVERAVACAVAMQQFISGQQPIATPVGSFAPALRVGMAEGPVLLMTIGTRERGMDYVVAGAALDRAAQAQSYAEPGEVVLYRTLVHELPDALLSERRRPENETRVRRTKHLRRLVHSRRERLHTRGGRPRPARFYALSSFSSNTRAIPLPPLADYAPAAVEQIQHFLHPMIVERLVHGQPDFLDEHRSVWVLFVAFAGFDFDSDAAVVDKVRRYFAQVQAIVARYDGAINKVDCGDKGCKFIVLFGAPIAHADDAERALHCALDLRNLDGQLRIGIGGGFAYCGLLGSTTRREYGIIGDEINLAARLMQSAEAGQVLVSARLWRMVEHGFSWHNPRVLQLKGRSSMVTAHTLNYRRDYAEGPLNATTPLIGRSVELRWLAARLARAGVGHGQLALLSGEAGIGKTRLLAALNESAHRRGAHVLYGATQSYRNSSPYLIWQSIVRGLLDLDATLPTEAQIERLERSLRRLDAALLARMPLLGIVLNLPLSDNSLTAALDPRLRKASLETMIGDLLRAYLATHKQALVVVLDNAHWMDALSRSLLETLTRTIVSLPVFVVVAYRPYEGEAPPILRLPHMSALHIDELDDATCAEYVTTKYYQLARLAPPTQLAEHIGRIARGNPFFIEELLKLLHEQNMVDVAEIERAGLPQSLHSLVLSRLDRLAEDTRTALKVASVIGQQFPAHWLQAILPEHNELPQLIAQLEALCRNDLTAMSANGPLPLYTFRHSATRDVAYESLALATRAVLHERTGVFIEQTYADQIERYLDLLAYHYGLSANVAKQREFFARAGEAAQAAYANEAAIGYYERLIPLLTTQEQPAFLLRLAEVQRLVGSWDIAEQLYQRAHTLSDDSTIRTRCLRNLGEICRERGNFNAAHRWLAEALAGARALGDRLAVAQTLQQIGSTMLGQGDLLAALDQMEQARALIEEIDNPRALAQVLNNAGLVHQERGDLVRALDCFLRSERIARDIGDPLWTSIAVGNSGNAHLLGGDYARAMACYQQQLRVAQELGDRYGISLAVGNMGNIYEYQGENGAARACYLHALQLALELGDQPGVVIVLWSLATLSLADEVYAESQRLVDQAITLARALDLHYDLCACLYTRALILTRIDGDLDEASRLAVQARELAVHTDHSDIALRAELLEVRLAVKQQRISMAQGIERLEALFDQWELADEQAAIRYTIWRLDNRQRVHGFEAARQYRALYAETPRHEYRECYAELTGAALPPAPTLPPLPITITRDAINLTTLDEAVTNLIYARDLAL